MNAIDALAAAIGQRAREIYDANGDDAAERADAKDLCRALARILSGVTLHAAFGSPGDWGYGTPIGEALARVYSEHAPANGAGLIAKERERQLGEEGWTTTHDDRHTLAELTLAGFSYASLAASQVRLAGGCVKERLPVYWPWDASWYKPSADPIRNLVKAGALIAAEIDRLQRKAKDVQ